METTEIKPKTRETPKNLNGIIAKIVEEIEVERIYLNRGTDRHAFIYRLNIITKIAQSDISGQVIPFVNSIVGNCPDYSCRVFTFSHMCNQAQEGNLYFLNNCHENDLVYRADNGNQIRAYPDGEPIKLYETIKKDFKRDMSRMKSFKKGFHYFQQQRKLPQSAFMAHQTFEQGYRILERFICGKVKICHSIKNHQSYVLKSLDKLEGTFDMESNDESRLLDLLEDAYSSARYTNNYDIGKQEVERLSQKLARFIKGVKSWFDQELSVFKKITDGEFDHQLEQVLGEPNNYSAPELLVRKFEYDSPFEMLWRAKSMMNLCLTCLEADVGSRPGTYLDFDVLTTLEFAVELLPLKETSP